MHLLATDPHGHTDSAICQTGKWPDSYEQAKEYRFDPFDVTKVWFHTDFPPLTIGRMVLNRNPKNYFAEVEQSAFSPANFVPGIAASPAGRLIQEVHIYALLKTP
ncbi:MAG: catalase [Deltaproteobacteria bacterium]|nr:catalase [Deltaproteobacteria bacterium]